ncbi:hypothetical protein HBI25_069790 [Parastagonospora nodorum]|nr:hypothetical protein HBI09_078000 [Parastagonospora nodorum]KAH4192103.1 hypothetical protein HBH42_118050 [Parastagonospora nodorum]KAH4241633.1 hypothetical protein HBI05_098950 [Parastagonospora nodorum]KAH4977869.1 hypothetical protein HBI76_218410 [Parastagonospora nodorum]KAH5078867.1 hypothetical protein HBH95_092830 [Parastagonospora nodorum]
MNWPFLLRRAWALESVILHLTDSHVNEYVHEHILEESSHQLNEVLSACAKFFRNHQKLLGITKELATPCDKEQTKRYHEVLQDAQNEMISMGDSLKRIEHALGIAKATDGDTKEALQSKSTKNRRRRFVKTRTYPRGETSKEGSKRATVFPDEHTDAGPPETFNEQKPTHLTDELSDFEICVASEADHKPAYIPNPGPEEHFFATFQSRKDISIPPIQVAAILDITSEKNTISQKWDFGKEMWEKDQESNEKPLLFRGRKGHLYEASSTVFLTWRPVGSEKWVTSKFFIVTDVLSVVTMGKEFVDFQGIFHDMDFDISPFRLPGSKKSRTQKLEQQKKQEEVRKANLDLHEQAQAADRLERQERMATSTKVSS